jgi:hypothetical protein
VFVETAFRLPFAVSGSLKQKKAPILYQAAKAGSLKACKRLSGCLE